MDLRTVTANGFEFEVYLAGPESGPAVLLLHGFPQDALSWLVVSDALATAGLRVFAINQRGYSPGARPEGVDNYTVERLAADALAIAVALGISHFHLAGHDWGAAVAWYLAAHHPDVVDSLVAVSVPHLAAFGNALLTDPDQQERSEYITWFRQVGYAEEALLANDSELLRGIYGNDLSAESVDRYLREFNTPEIMTAMLNWYRAMSAEMSQLPKVQRPTTFIWGQDDIAIARSSAEACGDYVLGDYRFVQLDGGHWLPDTHPELLAAEIVARAASTQ